MCTCMNLIGQCDVLLDDIKLRCSKRFNSFAAQCLYISMNCAISCAVMIIHMECTALTSVC